MNVRLALKQLLEGKTPPSKDEVFSRYNGGESLEQIAKSAGVSVKFIEELYKKASREYKARRTRRAGNLSVSDSVKTLRDLGYAKIAHIAARILSKESAETVASSEGLPLSLIVDQQQFLTHILDTRDISSWVKALSKVTSPEVFTDDARKRIDTLINRMVYYRHGEQHKKYAMIRLPRPWLRSGLEEAKLPKLTPLEKRLLNYLQGENKIRHQGFDGDLLHSVLTDENFIRLRRAPRDTAHWQYLGSVSFAPPEAPRDLEYVPRRPGDPHTKLTLYRAPKRHVIRMRGLDTDSYWVSNAHFREETEEAHFDESLTEARATPTPEEAEVIKLVQSHHKEIIQAEGDGLSIFLENAGYDVTVEAHFEPDPNRIRLAVITGPSTQYSETRTVAIFRVHTGLEIEIFWRQHDLRPIGAFGPHRSINRLCVRVTLPKGPI